MKKLLSIILSIMMLLSMTTGAFADGIDGPIQKAKIKVATSADFMPFEYYDENDELTGFDIDKAHALNITNADGNYNFPGAITREEFCELVYNYISEFGELEVDDGHIVFIDTDNIKIRILNTMGIIKGKSETQFAPNDLLTREEAATILNRLINVVHPDLASTELYYEFADGSQISDWAMSAIQRICNMGIMKGVENNNFAPKDNYTTEQAIVTLVRVYTSSEVSKSDDTRILDDILFADKVNTQMPTDKNYMFSPISIKMALALAANGASGETQQQILNALGLTSLDEFNSLSKDLIERYSQTDILKLNIANSIWMNKDKTTQNFSNSFKKTATDFYDAEVKSINNSNAVKEINSWVSDKTNGKIPTIIQNADDFRAMLINVIYFKGAWLDEFNVNATKPDRFNNADGTKITVDFMNKTKWFPYVETKSVKMIELPYQNRVEKFSDDGEYLDTEVYKDLDVSMYLIMAENDINVERELSAAINDNAFKSTYIKMAMPKFKIEYSTDLNEIFMNMGITTAFDEKNADFTKMFDKGNMWFTKTIHKTFIDADEKGTEAAAVTAIGMAGSALPPEPLELKFNKPFFFAIRDNTSGETLFMGRFAYGN
ncbi:MAG: S-layer homology domain-containing protein [Clostridia bacterium]|nr:S-layer homology domain-containing protein [Clostridia bacterium]